MLEMRLKWRLFGRCGLVFELKRLQLFGERLELSAEKLELFCEKLQLLDKKLQPLGGEALAFG